MSIDQDMVKYPTMQAVIPSGKHDLAENGESSEIEKLVLCGKYESGHCLIKCHIIYIFKLFWKIFILEGRKGA